MRNHCVLPLGPPSSVLSDALRSLWPLQHSAADRCGGGPLRPLPQTTTTCDIPPHTLTYYYNIPPRHTVTHDHGIPRHATVRLCDRGLHAPCCDPAAAPPDTSSATPTSPRRQYDSSDYRSRCALHSLRPRPLASRPLRARPPPRLWPLQPHYYGHCGHSVAMCTTNTTCHYDHRHTTTTTYYDHHG